MKILSVRKIRRSLVLYGFQAMLAIAGHGQQPVQDTNNVEIRQVYFPQPLWLDSARVLSGPFKDSGSLQVEAVYLENGTESSRLDSAEASEKIDLEKLDYREAKRKHTPVTPEIPPFWKLLHWDLSQVFSWATWPSGLQVESGPMVMDFYPDPGDLLNYPWTHKAFRYRTDIRYNTGTKWFTAGFGLIFDNLWGRLVKSIESRNKDTFREFGYSLTLGGPGLRYEFHTAAWAIHEFAFLEKNLPNLSRRRKSSSMLYQYFKPNLTKDFRRNKSHRFAARFGLLRYDMIIDTDVYNHLVHQFRVKEMRALFGTWGLGFTSAGKTLIPGFYLTLLPVQAPAVTIAGHKYVFSLQPLNVELHFRNKNNYLFAFNFSCHLTDPLHALYGVFNLD